MSHRQPDDGQGRCFASSGVFHILLSPAERARYTRQLALPEWGLTAQERLKTARVFIAGAGGLACIVAGYLIAAGVGRIRIVDNERIMLQNLHHQLLYREKDLERPKAVIVERRLKAINPFAAVEALVRKISEHNVFRLSTGYDVLVDALNNFSTLRLLNRAAIKQKLPLVHAAVTGWRGRLTTFWPGCGPCVECVFPLLPPDNAPGLLGPLSGILGSLQGLEVLRILGGLRPALVGRMLLFDGQGFRFTEQGLEINPHCPACGGIIP